MEQSPDPPPDPQEEHISSHAPRDINRHSSALEHPLAIKNTTSSWKESPLSQASVSVLSTGSHTRDDWRTRQDNAGVQIPWKPQTQERNGEMQAPILNKMEPKSIEKCGLLGNGGKVADKRMGASKTRIETSTSKVHGRQVIILSTYG